MSWDHFPRSDCAVQLIKNSIKDKMIRGYYTRGQRYEIVPPWFAAFPGANTFTVIVGKNGTGKSRLLQGVVAEILKDRVHPDLFDREERSIGFHSTRREVECDALPQKVICVSTSPFDKFPLIRRSATSPYYSYLGLRGLPSQHLSTAYISRIIGALIRSMSSSRERARSIHEVLSYLGYDGSMLCTLSVGLSTRVYNELVSSTDLAHTLQNLSPSLSFDGMNANRQLRDADPNSVREALGILQRWKASARKPRVEVLMDRRGVHCESVSVHELMMLVQTGLARLRDVALRKADEHGGVFRLTEASSGEQSVIMGLLGIASEIEDGSLICIDEPEVCLHPAWQERYVHLLLETFASRKDCQFLVATHSPQVVAELPQANCFVMDMADGQVIGTESLSHRSIDFQLANVFGAPGHNNEYLNRTALNLFSRVASNKRFQASDLHDITMLEGIHDNLRLDDPLRDLIAAISEMKETYDRRDR
ncbi:AAA family ATPase [Cupriavidus campinensis]|uniref:ATP-binding protein n=1 Tax=Cupriavidus campinensis TaxID=151783 RepID=A0AAE9I028_9BURK|nr:ATP-binding protein [Cupriavidus campinensis]URF03968.1 ATP-binding protein [Cupriavidus campinensis]